ncbi:hypothetical protein, variant [Exophiala xenobiotica]|uniref:Putative zinc-finger domain-containing protein n=1 Tax=Exophiala xenobiotica TaxID=348802 RepID=A0A0D2ERM4_9EURO|nr:hypothetical protein, variant [Exophiala xenobiotica]KIW57405.1 hypothetical protein, variant [Exophiala xenobiotica]
MAHPYSSTPLYTGAPSYAPHQPYYPFPPNGLQQPSHTPPGLTQQNPQPPLYQPSPSTAAQRFDSNSQNRPPAPNFPPFPPPPTTLSAEFFKQFANAGLPPPPPPSFPPVPIPSTAGFPQFSTPSNPGISSPYNPQSLPASHSFASGVNLIEQTRLNQHDSFVGTPSGSRGGVDQRPLNERNSQSYGINRGGNAQPPRPASRDVNEKDQALPSFGSRSDLELLFANLQNQPTQVPDYDMGNSLSLTEPANIAEQPSEQAGDASPYDPTRPATIGDRAAGAFRAAHYESQNQQAGPAERRYDDKSVPELRQLAKGALLSLVPHKILYAELVREGVHPQVLRELYAELGIKVDADQGQPSEPSPPPATSAKEDASLHTNSTLAEPTAQSISNFVGDSLPQNEVMPSPAPLDATKQQAASSPGLERKDRIAQLLAAKTGRPTPSTPSAGSPAVAAAKPIETSSAPASAPRSPLVQQESFTASQPQNVAKAKAQTELVKARMEQLRRETQAKTASAAQPTFGSISQLQSSLGHPGLIPGLFMSSGSEAGVKKDIEMTGTSGGEQVGLDNNPLKRSFGLDSATTGTEPVTKKAHVEESAPTAPEYLDEQSEGEIIEEAQSDAMVTESEPGSSDLQEQYAADLLGQQSSATDKTAITAQSEITLLQNHSLNDAGNGDLYRSKQSEIEAMRRKIAELEQRNKLKRGRSQIESPASSNPATPVITRAEHPLTSPPSSQSPGVTGAGALSKIATGSRPIAKLTPAQLAERAAALKADLLKQRAQRQQLLQDGLPDLNLEVSKTEVRLEAVRGELVRARENVGSCRVALEQSINLEKKLADEVARLEKQLQEGRSGQKQYFDELNQIKLDKLAETQGSGQQQAPGSIAQTQPVTATDASTGPLSADLEKVGEDRGGPTTATNQPQSSDAPAETSTPIETAAEGTAAGPGDEQAVTEEAFQEVDQDEFAQGVAQTDTFQTDEMEISPEPEPSPEQASPVFGDSREASAEDTPMDMGDDSDGSASMSDSDEEQEEGDYEPAEAEVTEHLQPSDDSDEYDPEEAPVTDVSPTTTGVENEDEDFYEPFEHVDELDRQATPGIAEESAQAEVQTVPGFGGESTPITETVSEVPPETKEDDIESGRQLTEADTLVEIHVLPNGFAAKDDIPILDGSSAPVTRFVPYKTPLSTLKSFRFHRDYNDAVKSGYRSLTYSNSIDPTRPLCPTELAGETCTDSACDEQHFRQLGLAGTGTP